VSRRAALLTALLVSGCTAGPDFERPAPAAAQPTAAQPLGQPGPADTAQVSNPDTPPPAVWVAEFRSPKLAALIAQALADNWSLAAKRAALDRARARLDVVRGGNLPAVDAGGRLQRTELGATQVGPNAFKTPTFSAYGGGFTVSYDFDLFGQRRRRVEQAAAQERQAGFESDAAALALAANVALQAVRIATLDAKIASTRTIVAADERTLALTRQAIAVGAATQIGGLEAQSQFDRDRALLPPLLGQLATARDALAILVGKAPTDWAATDFTFADFALPAHLPGAIPSTLARRRPDILAAEAQLHAASASIGIAKADLYPRLDLTGALSREGLVGGPAAMAWTLVGGISAPVFHGGSLKAAVRGAEAGYHESFADYQQVVVQAMGEVCDALAALSSDSDALAAQENALASAAHSLELNSLGYRSGSVGLLDTLRAQRLLADARIARDTITGARMADTIKLYFALGLRPN
jgi:NodT family efflux transporter outer membrane factor (OMF) lipoprotein